MAKSALETYREALEKNRQMQESMSGGQPNEVSSNLDDEIKFQDELAKVLKLEDKTVANAENSVKTFNNPKSPINNPKDLLDRYQSFKSPKIEVSKDLLSNTPANTEPNYSKQDSDEGFNDLANPNLTPTVQAPNTKYDEITDPYRKPEVSELPKDSSTSGPTKPLSLDEQLEQAQRNRDIIAAIGTMGKGFEKFGAGLGGGSITQLKPDYSAQESFIKSGDQRVEDVKNLIKASQEARKLEQEQLYKKALMDKYKLEGDVSKAKLEGTLPESASDRLQRQRMEQQDRQFNIAEDRRSKQVGQQMRSQILTQVRGVLKDDPAYKKLSEQSQVYNELEKLIPQLEKGNQAALAATGTKLARAMGEVGVLTDADVTRYLGTSSWGRQLTNWYDRGMKGELPDSVIKELKTNISLFKDAAGNQLDRTYTNAAGRIKTTFPELGDEDINGMLGKPIISFKEKQQTQPAQPSQPKGQYPKTVRKVINGIPSSTTVESEAEEKEANTDGWK